MYKQVDDMRQLSTVYLNLETFLGTGARMTNSKLIRSIL